MVEKFLKCFGEEEFFGAVHWCEEDIANAIEILGFEPSTNNIAKIRKQVESDYFLDYIMECGLDYIYSAISSELKTKNKK